MARLFDDAASDRCEINVAVVTGYPFTLVARARFDDLAVVSTILALLDKDSNSVWHAIDMAGTVANDPVRAISNDPVSGAASSLSSVVTVNTWYSIVGVFESATSRTIWVDTTAGATNTTSRTPTGLDRTSVGRLGRLSPTNYMSGMIAEPAVYNVALTTGEIAMLALGLSPLMVRPNALVAYWPMLGNYSPEIDVRGRNELTVTGAVKADHPRVVYPWVRRGGVFVPAEGTTVKDIIGMGVIAFAR